MSRFPRPGFCLPFAFCAFGVLFAGAPLVAHAETAAEAASAQSAAQTPQGKFIQDLGDRAITILANKKITEDQRSAQFRAMMHESFDLVTLGRFVIGRSWAGATEAQREDYMRLFEALVVKTYSDRFALYTGEGFKVRTVKAEGDRDFIVSSDITHPDGSAPTTVDWRLRQKDGKVVGIIDVVVEGVSMSVTQKQEYASVIQRNGGDIEGLLQLMRQRLAEPSSKATPSAKS